MTPSNPSARKFLALAGALAAGALLAACGGSSPVSDPVNATAASRTEDALKFSRCMRDHGIKNFPNPEVSEGHVRLLVRAGPGGVEASPQIMEGAQKACQHYQEALAPKLTPQERVQREEAMQKFAVCMRQHGVHVETRTGPGGGVGVRIGQRSSEGGPNPESAAFQKAQEDCSKLLPRKPGAPEGGPPPGLKAKNRNGSSGGSGSSGGGGGGGEATQTFAAP